jgi:urocanate hydratase
MNAPVEITEIINAPKGTWLVYHRGYLPIDRGVDDKKNPRSSEQSAVHETATIAWKMKESGMVTLAQKRHGFLDYSYMALKTRAA